MKTRKYGYLFLASIFFFTPFFVSAATTVDVSIVGNSLRINSCFTQLPLLTGGIIGYKGYLNGVELFSTGQFGGLACFGGDVFIQDLNNFVSQIHMGPNSDMTWDFYTDLEFNSPPISTFTIHYDGTNFTVGAGGTPTCCSSVLFLPGIESSRLYELSSINNEVRLWEPGVSGSLHLSDLYMDGSGKSLLNVYTRDVIDEVYGTFNIYKSFLGNLEKLKSVDHSIADYSAVPYDWRLSIDDILSSGEKDISGNIFYKNATTSPYIISELRRLAQSSKNGKVTIISHSNGGLVAKALIKKLQDTNDPILSKIDKIIFVAVPQLGTPGAIAALLHGYDQNIPFFLNNIESRSLGQNMQSLYNLLPSTAYFSSVQTPVVTFDANLTDWVSRYGSTTTSENVLHNFLIDSYGRIASDSTNTDTPDSLNNGLLTQAENEHNSLDNWTAPSSIKVIEIAGWGIPKTVSGIHYVKNGTSVKPEPTFTVDGDGTVVIPSALYSNGSNVEKYWVDEGQYNKDQIANSIPLINNFTALNHKNILEVPELSQLIKDFIYESPTVLQKYISTSSPNRQGIRLVYSLHSPLTLDAYDNLGHHTGISTTTGQLEENIPGSYYLTFGDIKYIFTDTDSPINIFMNGYANGTFTFNIDELQGDTHISSLAFKDIPTISHTKVSIDTQSDINTVSGMKIDIDGNGIIDFNLDPKLNGIMTMPYIFSGFLQPINDTGHQTGQNLSVFKSGSTVPVKFQLKKYDGTIVQAKELPVWLTPQKGSTMSASVDESVYSDPGTSGNVFKWDSTSQQYVYNWSTKGLSSGYWYKIYVKLDDGNTYSVTIGLK
jgi:hypothetical protein